MILPESEVQLTVSAIIVEPCNVEFTILSFAEELIACNVLTLMLFKLRSFVQFCVPLVPTVKT